MAQAKKSKKADAISVKQFAIVYFILMGIFFFTISFTPFQKIIDVNEIYTRGVVVATVKVLGIAGIACTYQGSIIHLPSMALDVKFGCNGLEAVMIYSVAVIAFPASWRKRLFGILFGLIVIQAANILRIAALAYSAIHLKNFFEYIHVYVAQGMMIGLSLGIFFIYLHYAQNRKPADA